MERSRAVVTALIVVLSLFAGNHLYAQGGPEKESAPVRGGGGRLYDPKTVDTVSGEVGDIGIKARGKLYGLHAVLKTEKGEIEVHLGPAWYHDEQRLKIEPGDKIEVRGSRITFEGKPTIVAAEVKKGEQVVKLRNDDGTPAWRRRGWR